MINYRTLAAAAFLTAGTLFALPAQAQMINATSPEALAAYLRSEGASTEIKADSEGDPLIEASLGENKKFSVYFYGCTNHVNCQSVQYYAGYKDSKMDAAKLNEWNRTKRFGRAYIDEVGDPVVEMDIRLDDAGMSRALFADNFAFWKTLMEAFSAFVYK